MQTDSMDWSARREYARQMRLQLSPPEILLPDGSVHQDYFLPARFRAHGGRLFALEDRQELIRALVEEGFGAWECMQEGPRYPRLAQWSVDELQAAAAQLVGTEDVARYAGWKPSGAAALSEEREKNRSEALSQGRWDAQRCVARCTQSTNNV